MKRIIVLGFLSSAAILLLGQDDFDLNKSIERGREIYLGQCISCHLEKGEGIETIYPPLAKSDFLMNETEKSIGMILKGGSEAITVNGIQYNGEMPNFNMNDDQISDVMNYIRNTWGNSGAAIKPIQVKRLRNNPTLE